MTILAEVFVFLQSAISFSHANSKYSQKIHIMTRFELIKANQAMLQAMVENQIYPREVQNLGIYEEFKARKAKKEKISYIVYDLKEKYNLTERGIYKIIKRMAKRIKL